MAEDLHNLAHALALLECLSGPVSGPEVMTPIVVSLPRKAWDRIHYLVARQCIAVSERMGHGGIVASYPPPKGKDWAYGFWFRGCWVETPVPAKPSPSEPPVDETGPA